MKKKIKIIVGQWAQGKTNELIRLAVEKTKKEKQVCAFMFDARRKDIARKYLAVSLGIDIKDFDYYHKFSTEEIASLNKEDFSRFHQIRKEDLKKLTNEYGKVFDLSIIVGNADTILFDDMEWLIVDGDRNITNESFRKGLERLENIPSTKEQDIVTTIQAQTYEKVKDWIPSNVETLIL